MAMQAAYLVPATFEGGGMRAEVFPLQPRDGKTWDAIVAIDFPGALHAHRRSVGSRGRGSIHGAHGADGSGHPLASRAACSPRPAWRRRMGSTDPGASQGVSPRQAESERR